MTMIECRTKEQFFQDALKMSAFGLVALPIIGQLVAISLLVQGFMINGVNTKSIYRNAIFTVFLVVSYLIGLGFFLFQYRQSLFHS